MFDISKVQGSQQNCKLFAQAQKKCLGNILVLIFFKGSLVSWDKVSSGSKEAFWNYDVNLWGTGGGNTGEHSFPNNLCERLKSSVSGN